MSTQSWWKAGSIVVVSAGLLLAPAIWAQKATSDDTVAESKTAPPEAAKSARATPAALPARPAPAMPAYGSGSDFPRWEWFLGYSYVRGKVASNIDGYNANGGSTNIEYNLNHWIGLVADFGGYVTNEINHVSLSATQETYLFGPRLNYRFGNDARHTLFGQALVGGAHTNSRIPSVVRFPSSSENGFAGAFGGGLDVGVAKHVALRLAQVESLLTNYDLPNGYKPQNDFRYSAGAVLRWGGAAPVLPSAACSVQPSEVYAGEPVTATAIGSNFNPKRTVKYNWSGTGVKVAGNAASTQVDTTGLRPGSYGVTANLSDGSKNGSASCSARFTVKEPRPPVISCSADPASVRTGGTSRIHSTASSPDGRRLAYSYSASAGDISGTGDTATLNTRGAQPGRIAVNCNVADDRNPPLTASATTAVNVEAPPPPPPEIKQLEARLDLHSIYFQTDRPTRGNPGGGLLDSQAEILKALAEDFEKYLKYKPDAHLILSGHADERGTEEYNKELTQRRVDRTKNFLVEHGVPADHIETRSFGKDQELSADQVKEQMADNPDLTPAEKEKMLKNLRVLVLANNRRVDVSMPTGQQSVRRYPFNAKDFLTLISPKSGEEKPPAKKQPKP